MVRIAHSSIRNREPRRNLPNRGGLGAVSDLELFEHLLHVFIHCGERNTQLPGDLAVGPALADLPQDLRLTCTQELRFVVQILKRAPLARYSNAADAAEEVSHDRLFPAS